MQKWNMEWFLNVFFLVWLVQFFGEKRDKSKFSWLALLFKHFLKLKFSPIRVSNNKESMICLTPKKSFFFYRIQSKQFFLQKKSFKKDGEWRIEQKGKDGFFFSSLMNRKSTRKLRTAIKEHLSLNHNPPAPWLRSIGYFRKQQIQLPIQISVRFRLLLRRNGIKCQKNLFWRYANCFEGVLIQ